MKKLRVFGLVCVMSLGLVTASFAQDPTPEVPTATPTSTPKPKKKNPLKKVCKKITELPNGCYIYKNSAPTRTGGPGTPLTGYRTEPTLIGECGGSLSTGGTTIYSKKGKSLGTCPFASAHGAYGRYRCTMQTASLRRMAVARTKKPEIYFSIGGAKSCVKVPDAGRCYGSVKGLCNRTIQ